MHAVDFRYEIKYCGKCANDCAASIFVVLSGDCSTYFIFGKKGVRGGVKELVHASVVIVLTSIGIMAVNHIHLHPSRARVCIAPVPTASPILLTTNVKGN